MQLNSGLSLYHCRPEIKLGFYGLLVCCRTIYAEVSALLYSSNRFVIRYSEKQSLSPLRDLTPSSLSSLTHLKITLNQTSCHHRDPSWAEDSTGVCDDYRTNDKEPSRTELHDAPLDICETRAKPLINKWKSTVEYPSRHISSRNLELCVVCDIRQDDLETAREVLKLMTLFSDLRNCHLRLSRIPTPQIQRIANDTQNSRPSSFE